MLDHIYEFIGYVAAILTTISFIPQAVRVFKTKDTKSLSKTMYILFCIGMFLWFVYGLLKNILPIIFANGITLLLGLYILWEKCRERNED